MDTAQSRVETQMPIEGDNEKYSETQNSEAPETQRRD